MEQHYVNLLVKIAVAASLASIMARFPSFQRALMREERTLEQRLKLALSFAAVFSVGVITRLLTRSASQTRLGLEGALDLGLEGSLIAGAVGGYVTGLVTGVLVSLPAMFAGEYFSMPLYAGVGVLGGMLRDLAPDPEEVWRFSPLLDVKRLFGSWSQRRRTLFHVLFLMTILFSEAARLGLGVLFTEPGQRPVIFSLDPVFQPGAEGANLFSRVAVFITSLFCVTVPLKIWNNMRTEQKLETQKRLASEARLQALMHQINPHFLFNTLNSVSSLVRINPEQARVMVHKLSNILRRLLRKQEPFTPLREELEFIDDYLSVEVVRFGDSLRFEKEVDPDTLDRLVPSMILQPLVENSIRHGLSSKLNGGMIRVRSRLQNGRLHLLVEDDGVGIPEAALGGVFEKGIGLSNVKERLKVVFGNDYRMWIDSKPGQGTRTEIEIPELQTDLAAAS